MRCGNAVLIAINSCDYFIAGTFKPVDCRKRVLISFGRRTYVVRRTDGVYVIEIAVLRFKIYHNGVRLCFGKLRFKKVKGYTAVKNVVGHIKSAQFAVIFGGNARKLMLIRLFRQVNGNRGNNKHEHEEEHKKNRKDDFFAFFLFLSCAAFAYRI